MKDLINKLIEIEKETARERGEYNLFGIFQRENSSWWNIVVAADWVQNPVEAREYLAAIIKERLSMDDFRIISNLEVVREVDPAIAYVTRVQSMYGLPQLFPCTIFDRDIKQALLIAFKSPQVA